MSEQLLTEILNEIKGMKKQIDGLEQGQNELRQGYSELLSGQNELRQDIVALTNKVDAIEVRLENEVIDKIGILFDAFTLRGDQIENLKNHMDEQLDGIALDISYLVGKSARQENAILELKRAK